MTSLLEEAAAEIHNELLERGNLKKRAYNPAPSYSSEGYVARISRLTCTSCGEQHESLLGIFHRERSSTGAIRDVALDLRKQPQLPSGENFPIEVTPLTTAVCPGCLPYLGFEGK